MASTAGGVDIEEVAASHPEKILRETIQRGTGLLNNELYIGKLVWKPNLASVNAGADSFLVVLDAERTQAAADAALAQSDALVTTYQIALFRALAGGWQAED